MKLTIFGSCRQECLYDIYSVTSIRNNLTFPHYTKEIIQAIEFCKNMLHIPHNITNRIFRSGILSNAPVSPSQFIAEFSSTDLFIVEIASRICYEYNGFYAHHILTEPKYGCSDRSTIVVRDLTDKEIEDDLLKMKHLLSPTPFIVVGHIYTRTSGKRFELVQLLERLCSLHSIPFFNPTVETSDYSPDELYIKEDVLAHYTSRGHQIIGEKYKLFINGLSR